MRVEAKRREFGAAAAALLAAIIAAPAARAQGTDKAPFSLTILSSHSGGMLPTAQVNSGHGCKGGNAAPAVQWSAPPPATQSFALTMFDSTARNGAGFWHWAMFDLPMAQRNLSIGAKPPGAKLGRNDFGDLGYGGACPPKGKAHEYHFTVWALKDKTLPLADGAADREVGDYLKAHAVGRADLMLMYAR